MKFEQFVRRSDATAPAVTFCVSDPTGLGVIRNLARQGIPVLALDGDPRAAGLKSRFAAQCICPDPHYDEAGYISMLQDIGRCLPQKAVLIPCQDDAAFAASRNAETLEPWYLMPFSRWPVMSRLALKDDQIKVAMKAGIDVPRTAFVRTSEDLADAIRDVPFPAILKSAKPRALQRQGFGKAVTVAKEEDLTAAWKRVCGCGTMILQETIPGGDDELFGYYSYLNSASEPLAQFTCQKLRQHPRLFGEARFGESVWVQEVADQSLALLREFGFHGVSGIEFKRDPRDGKFKFMEVNVRHTTRVALAAACGVNITYAAYRDALGRPEVTPAQEEGPRWIYSCYDVPDSIREIVRGELSWIDWTRSLKGTRLDAMLAADDPIPGLYQWYQHIGGFIKARVRLPEKSGVDQQ